MNSALESLCSCDSHDLLHGGKRILPPTRKEAFFCFTVDCNVQEIRMGTKKKLPHVPLQELEFSY